MQYIGAYKAVTEPNEGIEKRPITTIIGSSAGGIIGLGICCQMSCEEIVQLCIEQLG